MLISMCVAMSPMGVIGEDGELPWPRIRSDMKRFRKVTLGKTVLMGSRTWKSLPPEYRPLPERQNIVLTRDEDYGQRESCIHRDVLFSFDIDSAILWARENGAEELVVIGGAEVYAQTIAMVDRVYLTIVAEWEEIPIRGDTYFPDCSWRDFPLSYKMPWSNWKLTHLPKYDWHRNMCSFHTLERKRRD